MAEAVPVVKHPICVTELLQLTQLGIPLEHITWARVNIASDQWLCVRHGKVGHHSAQKPCYVTLLNPSGIDVPQTWKTTACSVKMNPWKAEIAVRAGHVFEIYSLEQRHLLWSLHVTFPPRFWSWVTRDTIAIISDSSVYHWTISEKEPQFMFSRHLRLEKTQLINYTCDASGQWFALTGLLVEDDYISGMTQIYSMEQELSQPIRAHAVTFCQYQVPGNQHLSSALVIAAREAFSPEGKVHVIELGPHMAGNAAPSRHTGQIIFNDQWDKYDFPIAVQVSEPLGLIYITNKYGQAYICDLPTATCLATTSICPDIVFATALNTETQGLLAVSRNGQVLLMDVKLEHLIHNTRNILHKAVIADRLGSAAAEWKKSIVKDHLHVT